MDGVGDSGASMVSATDPLSSAGGPELLARRRESMNMDGQALVWAGRRIRAVGELQQP